MRPTSTRRTEVILELVRKERVAQEARYGEANLTIADGTGPETRWLLPLTTLSAEEIEVALRSDYEDFEEETGAPTWVHLVREEVAEAFQESDPARLREELIQVAALCVSWAERLPSPPSPPPPPRPQRKCVCCGDSAGSNGYCGPSGCYNRPA